MKKIILFFVLFLLIGLGKIYSQTFEITYSRTGNQNKIADDCVIAYNDSNKSVEISSYTGTTAYSPVKLDRTYYEQGLYFEVYIPTNLSSYGIKRIYKFAYDSKDGEPVLVTEISYTSKSNYQVKLYYTNYYFELGKNR